MFSDAWFALRACDAVLLLFSVFILLFFVQNIYFLKTSTPLCVFSHFFLADTLESQTQFRRLFTTAFLVCSVSVLPQTPDDSRSNLLMIQTRIPVRLALKPEAMTLRSDTYVIQLVFLLFLLPQTIAQDNLVPKNPRRPLVAKILWKKANSKTLLLKSEVRSMLLGNHHP
jgi:hypothetical protein